MRCDDPRCEVCDSLRLCDRQGHDFCDSLKLFEQPYLELRSRLRLCGRTLSLGASQALRRFHRTLHERLKLCDDLDHELCGSFRLYHDFTINCTTVSGFATTQTLNSTTVSGSTTTQTMNSTTVSGSVQVYHTFCDSLRLSAPT